MAPDEYLKAFEKAIADLEDRAQRRDLLNAEIAGLKETIRVLSSRVEATPERQKQLAQLMARVDYATSNLADAIDALLTRNYPKEMTPVEIRNALEQSNFDFDDFSNPLSACHAALKRMVDDDTRSIKRGKDRDGKATYRWKPLTIPARSSGRTFTMYDLLEPRSIPGPWDELVLGLAPPHAKLPRLRGLRSLMGGESDEDSEKPKSFGSRIGEASKKK